MLKMVNYSGIIGLDIICPLTKTSILDSDVLYQELKISTQDLGVVYAYVDSIMHSIDAIVQGPNEGVGEDYITILL